VLRTLPVQIGGFGLFDRFVAFSPDGKTVVTNTGFGDLNLWDILTGKLERTLETTGGYVRGIVFSQNGITLVTTHGPWQEPACVRVWDLPTGQVKRKLAVSTGPHPALSLSDDGKRLSVKQGDSTVQLWDVHTRRLLATLVHLPASKPGAPLTDWVVFTPDGYYDGSRRAEQFIRWRLDNRLFPARKFERRFRRPDVVRDVLQQSKK
jgi:WD40 repeat protein